MTSVNSSTNNINRQNYGYNPQFEGEKDKTRKVAPYDDDNVSAARYVGGFLAGACTKNVCSNVSSKIFSPFIMGKVKDVAKISPEELGQVNNALNTMLKNTGLQTKHGVEIFKIVAPDKFYKYLSCSSVNKGNVDEAVQLLLEAYNKKFLGRLMSTSKKLKACKKIANVIANGKNAGYVDGVKKVLISDKLLISGFHELGHAMNANLGGIGKVLTKSRQLSLLTIPIMIIALAKNKKQNGEKPQGFWDKLTTFVKDNAGKLTFLSLLPKIAEEGLATLRGNKFAKQLLSPELFKKVAKTNALGFTTYLVSAVLAGVGIYAGTKLRDAIVEKKKFKSAMNV